MSLLDALKWERAVTELFRDYDRPYVRGDFSAVRVSTVREALASGQMPVWLDDAERPVLALHWQNVRAGKEITDSFGRVLGVSRGDLRIMRAACRPGEERRLASVLAELPAPRVWWVIWQESPVLRAVARAAGFRWVGSRIGTPAGELFGIWFRGEGPAHSHRSEALRIEDVAQSATLTRLTLPTVDVVDVVDALTSRALAWARHYSVYNVRNSWSALALRGYGDADFIGKPAEMSKAWKETHPRWESMTIRDTPLRSGLPECERLIDLVPGVKHRIRLMRLAPGSGELLRHSDLTDRSTGVRDGELMRIHFPLVTNAGVRFTMWNLTGQCLRAHMRVGEVWYLDSRKPHTAINGGVDERLHLVLDVEASPELRALLGEEAPCIDGCEQVEPSIIVEPHGLHRAIM